jgi:hypothetical protein
MAGEAMTAMHYLHAATRPDAAETSDSCILYEREQEGETFRLAMRIDASAHSYNPSVRVRT